MIRALYDAFTASLPPTLAGFPHAFGRLELEANARWPRVTWVPGGADRFGPGQSGRDADGLPYVSLLTRHAAVELHFWGEDETAAEEMMEAYVALLRQSFGAAVEVHGGYFRTEQQGDSAYQNDGSVYVLQVSVAQPVIRPDTWGVLEQIAQDCCQDC